jgi:hypothetical protein
MRNLIARLILIGAGGVALVWTIVNVRTVMMLPRPSGGIGAVSSAAGPLVLLALILLTINLLLRKAAARRGPLARRFRQTHFAVTLGYMVWIVVSELWTLQSLTSGVDAFYLATRVSGMVFAPFLPAQMFFAASVVAFAVGDGAGA